MTPSTDGDLWAVIAIVCLVIVSLNQYLSQMHDRLLQEAHALSDLRGPVHIHDGFQLWLSSLTVQQTGKPELPLGAVATGRNMTVAVLGAGCESCHWILRQLAATPDVSRLGDFIVTVEGSMKQVASAATLASLDSGRVYRLVGAPEARRAGLPPPPALLVIRRGHLVGVWRMWSVRHWLEIVLARRPVIRGAKDGRGQAILGWTERAR